MDKKDIEKLTDIFMKRVDAMLYLAAQGRGIEILLRIAHQTRTKLKNMDTYDKMMGSKIEAMQNLVPKQTLPVLFSDPDEVKRLELARDIGDKLGHGLIRPARKLIDEYQKTYGLNTVLNNNSLPGWNIQAGGHLIDEHGRHIDSIVDTLKSTNKNLIVEEFDVFIHNKYDDAAKETFEDAKKRITKGQSSLAIDAVRLHMFRGWRRGEKTYLDDHKRLPKDK